jgi:transposase
MRSRIEPMKKIVRSLRQHRELILNCFRAQKLISSGVVEGLNNSAAKKAMLGVQDPGVFRRGTSNRGKAKVTMRKSYGFRTYGVLELALYHSPGKLPEPESTHDFF